MPDPGLNHRLRQRSRRSGLIIGISMLLTIAFCVGAFTVIYTVLDNYTTDFVSGADNDEPDEDDPADENVALDPDLLTTAAASSLNDDETTDESGGGLPDDDEDPTSESSLPSPTPEEAEDEDGFNADYQINPGGPNINLREGAGTATSIVTVLDAGAPLQFQGEEDTVDGSLWMMFTTEDGLEGWVREVDVEPLD